MTQSTFWDRVRDNVSRGIRSAADRTDELARIGKLKLDLVNLKRRLVYELGELGKHLLAHIDHASKENDLGSIKEFTEKNEVVEILNRINQYRVNIEDTEKRIRQMSTSSEAKNTSKEETKDRSTTKTPPKEKSGDE